MINQRQIYKEMILELYKNPLNFGELDNPDISAKGHNPACGDNVVLTIKLDGTTVSDVKFSGEGCAVSIASLSLITDEIKGKTSEEILSIDEKQMVELLGIPISHGRMKCATLGLRTIHKALYERN